MPIDERGVGQRSQVLGGLQLGGVGREEQRWTWSGTRSLTLVCQPARSKSSTNCFAGLAPACWAKAAKLQEELRQALSGPAPDGAKRWQFAGLVVGIVALGAEHRKLPYYLREPPDGEVT